MAPPRRTRLVRKRAGRPESLADQRSELPPPSRTAPPEKESAPSRKPSPEAPSGPRFEDGTAKHRPCPAGSREEKPPRDHPKPASAERTGPGTGAVRPGKRHSEREPNHGSSRLTACSAERHASRYSTSDRRPKPPSRRRPRTAVGGIRPITPGNGITRTESPIARTTNGSTDPAVGPQTVRARPTPRSNRTRVLVLPTGNEARTPTLTHLLDDAHEAFGNALADQPGARDAELPNGEIELLELAGRHVQGHDPIEGLDIRFADRRQRHRSLRVPHSGGWDGSGTAWSWGSPNS